MQRFGVLSMGSRLKRLSDHLFQEVQGLYNVHAIPISATYFPILRLLQLTGPMSVTQIADYLQISHPAVSKQVSKMLKDGLLEKTLDATDQRRAHLQLSGQAEQTMLQAEPVLHAMKVVLEWATNVSTGNFLEALEHLEKRLLGNELTEMVMDRLSEINLVAYDECYQAAFFALNMSWLQRYFADQIIAEDYRILQRPQEAIIDKSGFVWLAVRAGSERVIGSIAMLPSRESNSVALLKLAVAEHTQGKGIAQLLMDQVIRQAQRMGVAKITLETASCLQAARRLYERNGFVEMPAPKPSLYQRADIYMEKTLEIGS